MACDSPTIDVPEGRIINSDSPDKLVYGFKMDNVMGVRNLTEKRGPKGEELFPEFHLFPNPIYESFEEIKFYKSDYLTINVSFQ